MSKSERNKTIRFSELDSDLLYEKVAKGVTSKDDSINKIIHGDSIEELKKISSGSIDLIATDPPYNLSKNYAGNKFSATDNESYEIWLNEWMKECKRILKDTGSIYVCCDWKSSIPVFNVLNKYFTLKNRITWEREKGRGASTNWKNNIEDVYFAVKDDKSYTFNLDAVKVKKKVIAPYRNQEGEAKDWFTENGENYRMTCPSNIWTDITIPFWSMPENTEHPTQKPEKVMAKIILASSHEGDIVLDPFVGSGTTAVVAKKLGRKFIGIEQEKEYCVVSQHRLNMADIDKSIQGIENGIFLERNSMSSERLKQPKKNDNFIFSRKIMTNSTTMNVLLDFIKSNDGIGDKGELINKVLGKFKFTNDRSVYYNENLAIRFCYSANGSFSNTVLSLSNLKKYDNIPFVVCLVTKNENILYLANTTFLAKISHSSQELREDNIKGSFNGSDILKDFGGYKNSPENFNFLFASHIEISFEENLIRLVEATNNIAPTGKRFDVTNTQEIFNAPQRAVEFVKSEHFNTLKLFLDTQVEKYKNEILIAGFIENVNIRGRIIEYLIAGEDESLRNELVDALHKKNRNIPRVKTQNDIGDYIAIFDKYKTATDIKTKIMILQSNPKAYNIDKLLEFLSSENSIFLFYFIGIEPARIVNQSLVSIFQKDLQNSTIIQAHWAGRNSRGVAQFNGEVLHKLIISQSNEIDIENSKKFLEHIISL